MNSREQLARIYLDMRPGAAAHVLETLPPEESAALLAELPARMSGPVLAAMLYHYAARCLNYLPTDYIVLVIQQLPSQRSAALLRGLAPGQQDAILNQLSARHASTIRFLLSYSNNLIGAWTDPNAITVSPENSVGETRVRLQQIEVKDIHRLFLVGRDHRLIGSVLISALFQAQDDDSIQSVAGPMPKILRARTSLGVAEQHKDWQQYLEMPVIGRADEFIGIITYKNLYRALQELRLGQSDTRSEEEQVLHGLTDLYRTSILGAWQTWMELLAIPVEDEGVDNERNPRRHRGA